MSEVVCDSTECVWVWVSAGEYVMWVSKKVSE